MTIDHIQIPEVLDRQAAYELADEASKEYFRYLFKVPEGRLFATDSHFNVNDDGVQVLNHREVPGMTQQQMRNQIIEFLAHRAVVNQ